MQVRTLCVCRLRVDYCCRLRLVVLDMHVFLLSDLVRVRFSLILSQRACVCSATGYSLSGTVCCMVLLAFVLSFAEPVSFLQMSSVNTITQSFRVPIATYNSQATSLHTRLRQFIHVFCVLCTAMNAALITFEASYVQVSAAQYAFCCFWLYVCYVCVFFCHLMLNRLSLPINCVVYAGNQPLVSFPCLFFRS